MYSPEKNLLYSVQSEPLKTWKNYDSVKRQCQNIDVQQNQEQKIAVFNNLNRGRVAIFIDGGNLFYAALQLDIEINYTKLLSCLTAGSKILRAFFYTGVDSKNDKQQSFFVVDAS